MNKRLLCLREFINSIEIPSIWNHKLDTNRFRLENKFRTLNTHIEFINKSIFNMPNLT